MEFSKALECVAGTLQTSFQRDEMAASNNRHQEVTAPSGVPMTATGHHTLVEADEDGNASGYISDGRSNWRLLGLGEGRKEAERKLRNIIDPAELPTGFFRSTRSFCSFTLPLPLYHP